VFALPLVVLALPALAIWALARGVRTLGRAARRPARAESATRAGTVVGRVDARPGASA
jgi:hypothetical protein